MSGFITNPKIISELKALYQRNEGLLTPQTIVNAAKNKKSVLHRQFEWDDNEAANQYRLSQARELLQVTIEYIKDSKGNKKPMRVFASLKSDRLDGGYRTMVDLLGDKEYRAQLLQDAIEELETFKRKYYELKELVEIFDAIGKVKTKAA